MDISAKALLIGVSLRYRTEKDGTQRSRPTTEAFGEALDRLTIDTIAMEPGTIGKMLDRPEQVVQWLVNHPKASVVLESWGVALESPDFDDVDFEQFDCPFDSSCAVEDYCKSRYKDGWRCSWSLC